MPNIADPEKPPEAPEGEEAPETVEAPPPEAEDPAVQALKILKDMQATPEKPKAAPAPAQPTYAEYREKIKAETGYTDAQVDFHLNSIANTVGPMQKQLTEMQLKDKFPDFKDMKGDIDEELKSYPPSMHGDPVLLEKIYWMSKGKKMATSPPTPRTPNPPPAPASSGRRIAQSYSGFDSGVDSTGGSKPAALQGQEKELARRMGVPEDKWAKSKTTKVIKELA